MSSIASGLRKIGDSRFATGYSALAGPLPRPFRHRDHFIPDLPARMHRKGSRSRASILVVPTSRLASCLRDFRFSSSSPRPLLVLFFLFPTSSPSPLLAPSSFSALSLILSHPRLLHSRPSRPLTQSFDRFRRLSTSFSSPRLPAPTRYSP